MWTLTTGAWAQSANTSGTSLFGINSVDGRLWRYDFDTANATIVGTIQTASGQVLTGIKAAGYFPGFQQIHAFWTDPASNQSKMVRIDVETAFAEVTSVNLGVGSVNGAVAVQGTKVVNGNTRPTFNVYAVQNQSNPGLVVLNPTAYRALHLDSNGSITATNTGGIKVNSNNNQAVRMDSNSVITTPRMDIVGKLSKTVTAVVIGTVNQNQPSSGDPLASLPEPSYNPANNLGTVSLTSNEVVTKGPGYYSGGINLDSNAHLTLLPGIYILDGVGLKMNSNARLTGNGVLIYIVDSTPTNGTKSGLTVNSNNVLTITPPNPAIHNFTGASTYAGVSFFQARANANPVTINSNAAVTQGTLYFPAAALTIDSNGTAQGSMLIVDKLTIKSNGKVIVSGVAGNRMVKVDTQTQQVTTAMNFTRSYVGLATQNGNEFYTADAAVLYRVNPTSGAQTLIGPMTSGPVTDFEFLGSNIMGFNDLTDRLHQTNPVNGLAIGAGENLGINDLGAIIFMPTAAIPSRPKVAVD